MRSLRSRLTFSTLLAASSLLLVAGILLDRIVERELEAALDAGLEAKAQTMIALTEQEGEKVLVEFAEVYLPNLTRRELVELRLAGGAYLARSAELGEKHLPVDDERSLTPRFRDLVLPGGQPGRQIQIDFLPLVEGENESVLAVAAPPAAGDPSRPLVSVVVAVDSSDTLAQIRHFRAILAAISLAVLAGLAILLPWLVGHGLLPLVRLGDQVERMEVANLGEPLVVESPPRELQPLIRRLDDLRLRLALSFERERRFSSNVAHELRTPIAELRSLAEVALRFPPTAAENQEFYRDVLSSSRRMERVAEQLLALARLEDPGSAPRFERIELRHALEAVLRRRAGAENCTIEVGAPLSLVTNGTLFDLLLDNLLTNALEHRDAGSEVEIAAEPAQGGWQITFRNRASTLREADLEHLFDRFWRKDEARSGSRHSGLGLALARSICQALGIDIAVALSGGMFEIALHVPAAF